VLAHLAGQLPAATVRLCADDGARRREEAGVVPQVPAGAAAVFCWAQWLLLVLVLLVPKLVHIGDNVDASTRKPASGDLAGGIREAAAGNAQPSGRDRAKLGLLDPLSGAVLRPWAGKKT